jgi:hypothetical protein
MDTTVAPTDKTCIRRMLQRVKALDNVGCHGGLFKRRTNRNAQARMVSGRLLTIAGLSLEVMNCLGEFRASQDQHRVTETEESVAVSDGVPIRFENPLPAGKGTHEEHQCRLR